MKLSMNILLIKMKNQFGFHNFKFIFSKGQWKIDTHKLFLLILEENISLYSHRKKYFSVSIFNLSDTYSPQTLIPRANAANVGQTRQLPWKRKNKEFKINFSIELSSNISKIFKVIQFFSQTPKVLEQGFPRFLEIYKEKLSKYHQHWGSSAQTPITAIGREGEEMAHHRNSAEV